MTADEKLGRKKEQPVLALVTARSTEEAAKSIGASAKTLLRWQKLPEFDSRLPGGPYGRFSAIHGSEPKGEL